MHLLVGGLGVESFGVQYGGNRIQRCRGQKFWSGFIRVLLDLYTCLRGSGDWGGGG